MRTAKHNTNRFWGHPWTIAACNIALLMVIYTLMRVFCYLIHRGMFPDVSGPHLTEMLAGGMRFDLTAVLYLSSAYLTGILLPLSGRFRSRLSYQRVLLALFWIPNILGILANCADMAYIPFSDRRTTCTFFTEFENDHNLLPIFLQGMWDYWYVTVFGLAMTGLLIWLTRKEFSIKRHTTRGAKIWYYVSESIVMAVSVFFIVIGIRGGFGRYTRPITISNAMQYTDTPRETALVLNTPFSLMKTIENVRYTEPEYFNEGVEAHMNPIHEPKGEKKARKENVVVIILESFSKEYIGFYNHDLDKGTYQGYTPFLDSLLAQSVTYDYSYASGRKSIDAMPSVLSSIPMLIEPYVVTPYSTNQVSSIAERLSLKGYQTAFFHGAPNGSMGFQAYARSAGFQHYYGLREYGKMEDFDGTWAIWDEEFLQYFGEQMSKMREPFMTAVFTASSHHPFKVPARYEHRFPKGTLPIHQTIGYADYALRRFFAYAKQQPWYEHTLFVITADHTNELSHAEYTNARGIFEVPIAFFHPKGKAKRISKGAVSQTDIMPSVLSYLGYDRPYLAFGEDALTQPKQHPYAVCYNQPLYQILSDSLLVEFDGKEIKAVYDYRQDRMLKNNLAGSIDEKRIAPLSDYLKGYIQQYIHRMITDELTAE